MLNGILLVVWELMIRDPAESISYIPKRWDYVKVEIEDINLD
jgi:hypothetical protein